LKLIQLSIDSLKISGVQYDPLTVIVCIKTVLPFFLHCKKILLV